MKRNNIYLLVLILGMWLGIGACVKEPDPGITPPPEETGEGFVSFRLGIPTPETLTRAGETENGTELESKVQKVWILLYAKEGDNAGELMYAYDYDVNNFDNTDVFTETNDGEEIIAKDPKASHNPDKYSFVTLGVKVKNQSYDLVVIANPGFYAFKQYLTNFTNKDETLNGDDPFFLLSNLQKANGDDAIEHIVLKDNYDYYHDYGYHFYEINYDEYNWEIEFLENFFMSNANGLVPVTADNIKSDAVAAQKAPVKVAIDRALAQVMVNAYSASSVVIGEEDDYDLKGKIRSLTWGLKNVNKKSYLYRNYAPLFAPGNSGTGYLGNPDSESTHALSIAANRAYIYATDPNFGEEQSATDFWDNNFWDQSIEYYIDWNANAYLDPSSPEEPHSQYVTENTMSLSAQKIFIGAEPPNWDYTTLVRIRAYIDYLFDAPSPTSSYYSYSYTEGSTKVHRVFTLEQVKTWIKKGEETVPGMGQDFWQYIDPDEENPNRSSFFDEPVDALEEPLIEHIEDDEGGGWSDDEITRVIMDDAGIIAFHPRGLNEYSIPIKHFNFEGTSAQTYGYYGVVRNNVYRIYINRIEGPGTPVLSPGEYISAWVTINPWFKRVEQLEDL